MIEGQLAGIGDDKEAAEILSRYAMWRPEIDQKDLCDPCNHCTGGDNCQPCGNKHLD